MKYLSFRIIFLCIFLPPVFYIFSIQGLEMYFQQKYTADLQKALLPDPIALLQGQTRIQNEISHNIDDYMSERQALKWGVLLEVVVRTKTGRWLYPRVDYNLSSSGEPSSESEFASPAEVMEIAGKNMEIMDEGLNLAVKVEIPRNSLLANGILVFYILFFATVLYWLYMKRAKESEMLTSKNQEALEAAASSLEQAEHKLQSLVDKEQNYKKEIDRLRAEVAKTSEELRDREDEALTEIETLEQKVEESLALREEMEKEVFRLMEEMDRLESAVKPSPKKLEKQVDRTTKRFTTLYKNLEFHDRAVEGFLSLRSDLQLKAEELIHNINENSDRLTVKRKVFAGKGALPTFETEFAYRGRIYWKRTSGGKVRVLAIGTKNTQGKDLAFLEGLEKK
jgi:hypothetical protein